MAYRPDPRFPPTREEVERARLLVEEARRNSTNSPWNAALPAALAFGGAQGASSLASLAGSGASAAGAGASAGSGAATAAPAVAAAGGSGGASAWLPSAINAGAQLGGALTGKHANNRATDTQAKAAEEALTVAKDNEARRRQEYDQAQAASKAQWDAEQARLAPYRAAREALLRREAPRYGLNLGALGGAPQASGPPPGWTPGMPQSQPRTIASLAGYDAPQENSLIAPAPQLTIADIANWGSPRRAS